MSTVAGNMEARVRCKYNMPIYTLKGDTKKTQFFRLRVILRRLDLMMLQWYDFIFIFERWNFVDDMRRVMGVKSVIRITGKSISDVKNDA